MPRQKITVSPNVMTESVDIAKPYFLTSSSVRSRLMVVLLNVIDRIGPIGVEGGVKGEGKVETKMLRSVIPVVGVMWQKRFDEGIGDLLI